MTATNTNVHSHVAAYTTMSTSLPEEEELFREAVQSVCANCQSSQLAPDTIFRLGQISDPDDVMVLSDDLRSANRVREESGDKSRSCRAAGAATTFMKFKKFGDSLTPISQNIAAPIWSVICTTMALARTLLETDDFLTLTGKKIIALLDIYSGLYIPGQGLNSMLRQYLCYLYKHTVDFVLSIVKTFQSVTTDSLHGQMVMQLYLELSTLSDRIEDAANMVDRNIHVETFRDAKGMILSQVLSPVVVQHRFGNSQSSTANVTGTTGFPPLVCRSFVGRERELSAIKYHFRYPQRVGQSSIVAIWGIGGVGKSQLALQYASNASPTPSTQYNWRIFMRADSKPTILAEYHKFAVHHGLSRSLNTSTIEDSLVVEVKRWFAQNDQWLLILDNAGDSNDIHDLLPSSTHGHILITTRNTIAAERLASKEHMIELVCMDPQTAGCEMALQLAGIPQPFADDHVHAAKAIALFAQGLPLVIEHIVKLARVAGLSLDRAMTLVDDKFLLIRRRSICSSHELNASLGAIILASLQHLEKTNAKAHALFKLLSYLNPSSISLTMLHSAESELGDYLKRTETYVRGKFPATQATLNFRASLRPFTEPPPPLPQRWKQNFKFFRSYGKSETVTSLPRVDSAADQSLEAAEQLKMIRAVLEDSTNTDNAINDLVSIGLVRRNDLNTVSIHELVAQTTRAITEDDSQTQNQISAHLAAVIVYLVYPTPDPPRALDPCLIHLPHALAVHKHLLESGILHDATIGPELSHLIASTYEASRRSYNNCLDLPDDDRTAVHFYKLSLTGYFQAWKRLQNLPAMTLNRIRMHTYADWALTELRGYSLEDHIDNYERVGLNAPWRCINTTLKLGRVLSDADEPQAALQYLIIANKWYRSIFGYDHGDTLKVLKVVMDAHRRNNDPQQAFDIGIERGIGMTRTRMERKIYLPFSKTVAQERPRCDIRDLGNAGGALAQDLGMCCLEIPGRMREALRWFDIQLETQLRLSGTPDELCASAMVNMANTYEQLGETNKCLSWWARAVDASVEKLESQALSGIDNPERESWLTDVVKERIQCFRDAQDRAGDSGRGHDRFVDAVEIRVTTMQRLGIL